MLVLSVNAGSSSLKFTGFLMPEEKNIVSGAFERIGLDNGFYTIKLNGEKIKKEKSLSNHEIAVRTIIDELLLNKVVNNLEEIECVGHRVVHGGEKYTESILIDDDVKEAIKELSDLAPLHNPANLMGIEVFMDVLPRAKHVAVFDTAFLQTMPKSSYVYPVPYEWYTEYGVRKYGFHGTSHRYVNMKISEVLGREDLKVISCHLGNGCSIAAIDSGKVIDTTLGFTPNAGLMMGTRSGDIDSSIIPYIMKKTGKSLDDIMNDLNKKSGMLGISGLSNDFRDIQDEIVNNNERCSLSLEMFIRRVVSYISSYYVLLNGIDVICFTAGIGENDDIVRKEVIDKLKCLDIFIDKDANATRSVLRSISTSDSKVLCYIVPTDEELMIARDTYSLIN